MAADFRALSRQPPRRIGRFFASAESLTLNHGGMMHGGGDGKIDVIGRVDEVFYTMQFR